MPTQSSADRSTNSLSLAHQRKNKQTNKNSAQISPFTKLTQTSGPTLGGKKPKGRKDQGNNSTFLEAWEKETSNSSLGKGDLKLNRLKKKRKKKKMQRNTAQKKEQQKSKYEGERGKLPEKGFSIMIVKMIKNLENRMEKCKNQLTKT